VELRQEIARSHGIAFALLELGDAPARLRLHGDAALGLDRSSRVDRIDRAAANDRRRRHVDRTRRPKEDEPPDPREERTARRPPKPRSPPLHRGLDHGQPTGIVKWYRPCGLYEKRAERHMPRPRFERIAPEKRDAVLDAAAKEFAEHGYDDASMNRI